ncbi:unnamed protein product [Adineta ricciae]|nr:unnamed protein product [Adineta ricciae]
MAKENNATMEMNSTLDAVQSIYYISKIFELSADIIILTAGVIGNVLIIFFFTKLRIFRGNQCAYYLKICAITDMGVVIAMLPSNIVGYLINEILARLTVIWCKIQLMSSYSCGLYSLYTICFIALDQYLSTNHRQIWRQMSTIRLAHCLSYFNMSVAVFHGILFLIFAEIGIIGCTIYHPIARIYFTFFYYPILSGVLPLAISSTLGLLAYRNVRRIIRRQIPVVRRRLDRQMTAIALARVLCIFILGVPFLLASLVEANTIYSFQDPRGRAILSFIVKITYTLLYVNHAINFYVFLIISPRFRHQIKNFILKKRSRQVTRVCNQEVVSPVNNQSTPENDPCRVSVLESV